MDSVTFALPTVGTAAMTSADQLRLVNRQALTIIVSSYLEHLNTAIAKEGNTPANFVTQAELISLINAVQQALFD